MEGAENSGQPNEVELTEKIEVLKAVVSEKEAKAAELDAAIEAKQQELKKLDAEGKKKQKPAKPLTAKLSGEQTVEFVLPKFSFNGTEYVAKDLESAVKADDAEAIAIVKELVTIGSTVVKIVEP